MLVNPHARRGEEATALCERLSVGGIDTTIERFDSRDEMLRDIARCGEGRDLIIVCGGDGTISAAAGGIRKLGLPMGILPLGTANDLARTLHIPDVVTEACDIILRGRTRRIDLGEVNGLPFFNVASIGLSADLSRSLDKQTKRRWGKLGYAVAAMKVLASARAFHAVIEGGGNRQKVKTLQIAIGNGRHYGGGNIVHEDATITDGRLDLYSLEQKSLWKLALLLGSFRTGRHGIWEEVRTERATEFTITTRSPRPVNADGDIVTETPAHVRVIPQAIEVFVP